jgi:hypothetical protein
MKPTATATLLLFLLTGCASAPVHYIHPNADIAALEKVAVLPFENVSGAAGASDKVHKIFLVELLSMEVFDVIEPGLVSKALKSEGAATPDQLTPDDLKKLGTSMGADALFLGQVIDYSEGRGSGEGAPAVTLQFRLVETASGATVWSSSETRAGVKASTRLFGVSSDSLTDATRRVIRDQLKTLLQ